ncbi:U3 small nucleolar ribonucleoprotein mpp10 [Ceratocystis fimbriata CBS 114723]|uniref:U3 small nucleolar ribonucleoprotein protein MPP10 n=1 Tax=Ceratocystis fimbriata CBS 114723 TaxID=1035309 RepID=A0A2C5X0X9_9PEZI|nr:U3 small nucleolar ribonucleoprotein mpp10 [Ceratocystis fimbriata CBS 114723]
MADGSIDSSLTSTSQTLTLPATTTTTSAMATTGSSSPYNDFLESLQRDNRHTFLRPTSDIATASLNFVKLTLDDFAGKVSDEQLAYVRELNKKRKRSDAPVAKGEVLKLRKVHVDGLETSQIWQQAHKIISSSLAYSQDVIRELEEKKEIISSSNNGSGSEAEELGSNSDDYSDSNGDDEDEDEDDEDGSENEGEYDETEFTGLDDDDNEQDATEDQDIKQLGGQDSEEGSENESEDDGGSYTEDPFGLNDGFFDIDEFNRQSQWLEEQDAKGDPYTDHVSDEEEIDWSADPMSKPSKSKSKSGDDAEMNDDDSDAEDDKENGPTFGNVDLFAPDGASEDGLSDQEDAEEPDNEFNANNIYFKDYFAPPPKRKSQAGASKPRKQPKKIEDVDVDRAMNDVRRDLFDDMSEDSANEDDLSDASAGDPKSRRSAHERRQAKLAEEIRKLEAAAVEKRQWTLSGEAAAADRPANSLLEEDLDFEYAGKPVPMITPEVTEGIEDMIKRRILAREFDEVVRRRPDTAVADTRRGLVEIDDTKSKKGLAEIYEEEHIKNANPDSYISQSDEKTQREEREVEAMWKSVCAKLDALSSWHYKPKPAEPSLTVVSDVATVAMEDAMPTTAQGVTNDSAIAPQELYKTSAATAAKGELVTRSGLPLARQELSRDERQRMRRRDKERMAKDASDPDARLSKKAKMQKDTIEGLRKGGVKVVNRKGEVVDVDGNKIKADKTMSSGNYKL